MLRFANRGIEVQPAYVSILRFGPFLGPEPEPDAEPVSDDDAKPN